MPLDVDLPIKERIMLEKKIGSGVNSTVFKAKDLDTGLRYAVKAIESGKGHLVRELEFYKHMNMDNALSPGDCGIPNACLLFKDQNHNFLVMDLLGKSVQDIFDACYRSFSGKDVFLCGIRILQRLEFVHNKGVVHRNIRPSNVLVGGSTSSPNTLFLVDFGYANYYRNLTNGRHTLRRRLKKKANPDTIPAYASKHAHENIRLTRRDDVISLGYLMIYLWNGKLPWQKIDINDPKRGEKVYHMKSTMSPRSLCKGMPNQMATYLQDVFSLKFRERPNYERLRVLLLGALESQDCYNMQQSFDWWSRPEIKNMA